MPLFTTSRGSTWVIKVDLSLPLRAGLAGRRMFCRFNYWFGLGKAPNFEEQSNKQLVVGVAENVGLNLTDLRMLGLIMISSVIIQLLTVSAKRWIRMELACPCPRFGEGITGEPDNKGGPAQRADSVRLPILIHQNWGWFKFSNLCICEQWWLLHLLYLIKIYRTLRGGQHWHWSSDLLKRG